MIDRLKELWRWVWGPGVPSEAEVALEAERNKLAVDILALTLENESLTNERDAALLAARQNLADLDAGLAKAETARQRDWAKHAADLEKIQARCDELQAEVDAWKDRHRAIRNYHQRGGKERRAAKRAAVAYDEHAGAM